MPKKSQPRVEVTLHPLVRSCWIHTAATAYKRTLRPCPSCGGTDYDACGQERGEYQCVNPACEAIHKIADLNKDLRLGGTP